MHSCAIILIMNADAHLCFKDSATGRFRSDSIFMIETNEHVRTVLRSHGVDAEEFTVS